MAEEMYTAKSTCFHPVPAVVFTPCLVRVWNRPTMIRKNEKVKSLNLLTYSSHARMRRAAPKVTYCKARPPIKILSPTMTWSPFHPLLAAIELPLACTNKVNISQRTNISVSFWTGMKKILCCIVGCARFLERREDSSMEEVDGEGKTRRQSRDIRR